MGWVSPDEVRRVRRMLCESQGDFADRFHRCRRTIARWEVDGFRLRYPLSEVWYGTKKLAHYCAAQREREAA